MSDEDDRPSPFLFNIQHHCCSWVRLSSSIPHLSLFCQSNCSISPSRGQGHRPWIVRKPQRHYIRNIRLVNPECDEEGNLSAKKNWIGHLSKSVLSGRRVHEL